MRRNDIILENCSTCNIRCRRVRGSNPLAGIQPELCALADARLKAEERIRAAAALAWYQRLKTRPGVDISCYQLGPVYILHLPGEPFVEYQLFAQAQRPDLAVFVAGYGDDGTGYIPTAKGYLEGGYEPTVALTTPESEAILRKAIGKLLGAAERK